MGGLPGLGSWVQPSAAERLARSVRVAGNVVSALTILGGVLALLLGLLEESGNIQFVAIGIAGMLWGWWLGAVSRAVAHLLVRPP